MSSLLVIPLFGCFYAKNPSPRAALLAVAGGGLCRLILEFALPKDGFLLIPYDVEEFLNYGPACSDLFPAFIDVSSDLWWTADSNDKCIQDPYEDYTGVDSLASFVLSFILFVGVQTIEYAIGGPIFNFGGSGGYIKDTTEHPLAKNSKSLANVLAGTEGDVEGDVEPSAENVGDKDEEA